MKLLYDALIAALNNGYTADVNTTQGWVTLGDDEKKDWVFLQGDEAYTFIDKAKELYNKLGDISILDAYVLQCVIDGYDNLFTEA